MNSHNQRSIEFGTGSATGLSQQSKFASCVAYAAVVAIIIPYASFFIVLPSDVQPLAGLLAIVYLTTQVRRIRLDTFAVFFLLFSLFYLVNINRVGEIDFSFISIRKQVNLLYAFIIYLFGRYCFYHIFPAVRSALLVLAFFAFLQLFARDLFLAVTPLFTNAFSDELGWGARGVSSLAPEPTDLGFMMLFVLLILFFLSRVERPFSTSSVYRMMALSGLIAFSTLAGSAFIGFFIAGLASIRLTVIKVIKATSVVVMVWAALIILVSWSKVDMRPLILLYGILTEPMFVIGNTSLSYRVVHFLVGPGAIFWSPLGIIGYGVGSSSIIAPLIYDQLGLEQLLNLNEYYAGQMPGSFGSGYMVSSAGQLMLESGLLGLFFMTWVLFRVRRLGTLLGKNFGRVLIVCYLMYFFQSFPLSWPLPWFLLGLLSRLPADLMVQASPPRVL